MANMIIIAEFTRDKHGWRCHQIWQFYGETSENKIEVVGNALYMPVKIVPKLGFCKRPHLYI